MRLLTIMPLERNGVLMDLRPVNIAPGAPSIRAQLDAHVHVPVILNPGDRTLYHLYLMRIDHRIVVLRMAAAGFPDSEVLGTVMLWLDQSIAPQNVTRIALDDAWGAELLAAFLNPIVSPQFDVTNNNTTP